MVGKKGKERGVGERGEGLSSLSPPSCFYTSPSPSSFCACHAGYKGFPNQFSLINSALRERPEGRLTFVLSHFTLLHNKLTNFNPMRTLSHCLLVDIKLSHDMTEINNNVQDNTQV